MGKLAVHQSDRRNQFYPKSPSPYSGGNPARYPEKAQNASILRRVARRIMMIFKAFGGKPKGVDFPRSGDVAVWDRGFGGQSANEVEGSYFGLSGGTGSKSGASSYTKQNDSFGSSSSATRADYLTGRTALHFAAVNGHVRCIRLVLADFVPSAPLDSLTAQAVVNNMEDAHEQIDTAIATALKESKPVYISISCNLPSIPHPTFIREPVKYTIAPSLSFLHLWDVQLDLDCLLVSEMTLKKPEEFILAPGLQGDRGSVTLASPGMGSTIELWKSSLEFSVMRSLTIVSIA